MAAEMNDADVLAAVVSGDFRTQPKGRDNESALYDDKLPAIVRGFIAINMGSAVETEAIEEAGFMPVLYGRHDGKACRVNVVSSLGDVGVSYDLERRHGYNVRVSIYEVTDYSLTPHPLTQRQVMDKLHRQQREAARKKGIHW